MSTRDKAAARCIFGVLFLWIFGLALTAGFWVGVAYLIWHVALGH